MNRFFLILCSLILTFAAAFCAQSAVLLDDHWDDGDRTDTNLPEESAWFASSAFGTPTLSVASGALTGNVLMFGTNTSSRLWITHFTSAGSSVELGIGDTLKVTLVFIPTNVTASPSTTRGLRVGLFNFSEPGANRVTADGFSTGAGGGAPGTNVTGYMLNMNFAQTLTIGSPIQIMKRTDLPNINLMGATAVFTSLGSGGGTAGGPAFRSGVVYTMELSATRLQNSLQINARFSDRDGWSLSYGIGDSTAPTYRFDGFAIRPNSVADTAESFTFTNMKVELLPFVVRFTDIHFVDSFTTRLTWDALPGKTYQVDWRAAVDQGDWHTLGTVPATAGSAAIDDSDAGFELQRFYRLLQLP